MVNALTVFHRVNNNNNNCPLGRRLRGPNGRSETTPAVACTTDINMTAGNSNQRHSMHLPDGVGKVSLQWV
jgi:hypothetical protein